MYARSFLPSVRRACHSRSMWQAEVVLHALHHHTTFYASKFRAGHVGETSNYLFEALFLIVVRVKAKGQTWGRLVPCQLYLCSLDQTSRTSRSRPLIRTTTTGDPTRIHYFHPLDEIENCIASPGSNSALVCGAGKTFCLDVLLILMLSQHGEAQNAVQC